MSGKSKIQKASIKAITFEEFVQYGLENSDNIVNNMPWSFVYNGFGITHENDECYLIPTIKGGIIKFTINDMLIIEENGEFNTIKKSEFEATCL